MASRIFATATALAPSPACHQLHTIAPDDKHWVTVRQIIDAVDTWVQFNLKTEHGLAINGNEIYWFDYAEGQSHQFPAHTGPLLRLGVRPGSNEGWILAAYVEGRTTPIFSAKLWTLDAAQQLMAALSRASVDCVV
jgi:hypothetical protein